LLLLKENTRAITIVPQNANTNGLSHKSVLSIYKDREGITWYGTDGGGLNSYNPQTEKYALYEFNPDNANSISNNVVKAIHEDTDNNLWLATFFGGLNKLNKKTGQIHRYTVNSKSPGSISSNNTWCIFEDAQENLWIGNFSSGLDRFEKKTGLFTPVPQIYSNPATLSHVQVSSLVQDSAGYIWVGTLAGLNKMNPNNLECQRYFHDATNSNSLSDDFITCLFYDSKNRLWIGTDDGGINLMVNPGVFRTYGLNGELPDRSILSIQEDKQGNLWISTKNGLVSFDPSSETFYTMDDVDDQISSNFNWNSSAIDGEGNLYFGSTNGVCIFNPSEIEFQSSFPSLVFTGVKVFNENIVVGESYHGKVLIEKSVTYGGNVSLTAKENAFTIEFVAIEFNKPAKIKYKYKLIGFDNDWVTTDAWQPNATYTNLPGGDYTFVLTSTNSSGIWSSNQIELQVTIIPPFYKQWWFKLLLAMVLVIAGFVLYRINIEKHRRKIRVESLKREKELIELRNIELKSEIASNTILLLNKNESLEQLKTKLVELKPVTENQPKVSELIQMIDNQMEADVYWEQFEYNFDQVYMNLLTRLKAQYPDLTRTNLKLCAYFRHHR
jgi:ligand-binding sensor domain-containing protein